MRNLIICDGRFLTFYTLNQPFIQVFDQLNYNKKMTYRAVSLVGSLFLTSFHLFINSSKVSVCTYLFLLNFLPTAHY